MRQGEVMVKLETKNPLLVAQREISGAITFEKYEYQYHWALFKALDGYENNSEFVVFVELHEDVVLGDSLESGKVKFEFNQVKNISKPPLTVKAITRRTGAPTKKKNSILGKMLLGVSGRVFEKDITELNLVATCGFNLSRKDETLRFSLIKTGELHDDCIQEIESALSLELGQTKLPSILNFVTPDLPGVGFEHFVISKISGAVDKRTNGALCSVSNIYRILMDDLRKKGVITNDFRSWEELVRHKGLTNLDVEGVTSANTQLNNTGQIDILFNIICTELELHVGQQAKLRRAFGRYQSSSKFTKTTLQLDISNNLKLITGNNQVLFEESGVGSFIEAAFGEVSEDVRSAFLNDIDLKGAIIYELIMSII
jgi:hypothetical protein